jgi:hypothetical protein
MVVTPAHFLELLVKISHLRLVHDVSIQEGPLVLIQGKFGEQLQDFVISLFFYLVNYVVFSGSMRKWVVDRQSRSLVFSLEI